MSLAALRQQLAVFLAPPRAGGAAIPTGIAALDRALSDGGVPYGRLTEIIGARGSGKTTLVRQIVAGAIAARRWVAYVDATRTLAPRDWTAFNEERRTGKRKRGEAEKHLWVIRPPDASRSAWCADVLLRSGAFGLVVLDGGPPLSRPVAVRLTRLARDHDAALVVVGDERADPATRAGGGVGSAVRLRMSRRPGGSRRADVRGHAPLLRSVSVSRRSASMLCVAVEKGGRHHPVEVSCAIDRTHRLCAYSEVPDRRGVAPRNRRGERAAPDVPGARRPVGARAGDRRPEGGAVQQPETAGRSELVGQSDVGLRSRDTGFSLPRKRRCAEPVVGRDGFLLAGGTGR
jgi:recombination protein RecA